MKTKLFLSITTIMLSALSLSFSAEADQIQWTTEAYTAYAKAQECCVFPFNEETVYGPPLPITAFVSYEVTYDFQYGYGEAGSTITSSTMDVGAIGYTLFGIHSTSYATFSGTYRAYDPLFLFSYDYTQDPIGPYSFYLEVQDVTDSSILYSQSYASSSSDVIYVPTALNHDISVSFGVHMSGGAETTHSASASLTYNMSTSVAPEPISSILFITGGSLFTMRRFCNRTFA